MLKHLLDQYADDLTIYLERFEEYEKNYNNINAVLTILDGFQSLSGLKANRDKTMLTVFGCKDDDSFLCEDLEIKWVTNFKLLGIHFDQTLENMNITYEKAITPVKIVANSWRNRYVSIYGKVCVVKTLMLPKLMHIATVLPTLTARQIKEVEKIWHNYITPNKLLQGPT